MLWLSLLIAAAQPARFSPTDRAMLAALREPVASLENRQISQEQFEQRLPRSQISRWRRLQREVRSTRSGSADLAFVLAYYGVDYPRSLRRLLLPYRRGRRARHPSRHDEAAARDLPIDLEILYRKHHDTASLAALLDLELEGAAVETPNEALYHLWGDHPAPLLRLAATSTARTRRVAAMLAENYQNPVDRKEARDQLKRLTHHPDARVAGAAWAVLGQLPPIAAWPLEARETPQRERRAGTKPENAAPSGPTPRSPQRPGRARLVLPYGTEGHHFLNVDVPSPDGKYIARHRTGEAAVVTVTVVDARSHRPLLSAEDVCGFMWVPHHSHRLVVAASGLYGKALLAMWEGGRKWRSLHRVRRPIDEGFNLFGATLDGRFIRYEHIVYQYNRNKIPQALHHRLWLRLPSPARR